MSIIRKIPWTRQPLGSVSLNTSFDGIGKCVFARLGDYRDIANNDFPSVIGSSTPKVATVKGLAVEYANANPDEYGSSPRLDGATKVTVYALIQFDSLTTGSNENRIILRPDIDATHTGADFTLDIADGKAVAFVHDGSFQEFAIGSTTIVTGQWYMLAMRWKSGGVIDVFVDGLLDGTSVNTQTVTFATGKEIWIGGRSDGTDDVDGRIAFITVFRDYHSLEKVRSISNNPHQIFQPRTQIIPTFVEAVGGRDILATLVNVSMAPVDAAINATRELFATLVDVPTVDIDANVTTQRDLEATLVDIAIADIAANVTTERDVIAILLDVPVADIDATVELTADRNITAMLANVGVADIDADATTDRDITATLVDVAIAKLNATIGRAREILATLVNVTVQSFRATVEGPGGDGPTIRRMWRSVWGRVWKDPDKMDEDT